MSPAPDRRVPRGVRKAELGPRDEERLATLGVALSFAVPLWIAQLRPLTATERARRGAQLARILSLGEKHDDVRGQHGAGPALFAVGEQARGASTGGPAAVFNALAEGLALGAFQPGGVTYLGQHWQVSP